MTSRVPLSEESPLRDRTGYENECEEGLPGLPLIYQAHSSLWMTECSMDVAGATITRFFPPPSEACGLGVITRFGTGSRCSLAGMEGQEICAGHGSPPPSPSL